MSLGLALSGGGAKGTAHIGVLEALKDNNIKLDDSQEIKAVGPAVYETNWVNGASQIITPRYTIISKNDTNEKYNFLIFYYYPG